MVDKSLIWELTKRDFTERFAGSTLGALWAIVWPLTHLAIYIIIFGKVMGARLPLHSDVYGYGLYVAVGLVPWTLFANSIARSSSVFLDKKHLISRIRISLPSLLVHIGLSETITYLISMCFLLFFLLMAGYFFSLSIVLVPFVYFLQLLFAFGFGLMAATFTVFIRDLREIIGIILQFWFWFTPIVYVREILPEFVREIIVYNPAYVFIDSYQRILFFNEMPSFRSLIILTLITHLMIALSFLAFRFLEKDVRDFL